MPLYVFRDSDGNEFEHMIKLSELEQFKKDNQDLQMVFYPSALPGEKLKEPTGAFRDVLQKIGDANPGSYVAEKYGSKHRGVVETKDRQILDKIVKGGYK